MALRIRLVLALLALGIAAKAEAIPAFARKYGMACSACHVAWPILNQEGQNFRDNGYRFKLTKDSPDAQRPEYVPISLRTTAAYQFTRTDNQQAGTPDAPFPVVSATGGVANSSLDILTAGTIADNLSFLVVASGFNPSDPTAALESAWGRLDDLGGSGWLNLKVGKFELDLPASPHRAITLTSNYAVFSPHLQGSMVAFDMTQNQLGLELDGHDARSTTRYNLSLVSANGDPGSKGAFSSPLLYGHVQQAIELDNGFLPWIRVGVLGALGWWPTQFASITTTTSPTAIAGTGYNHKTYSRVGGDLSWIIGYPSAPIFFTVAYLYGREEAGLASCPDASGADACAGANHFSGGYAEVDWAPSTTFVFFARYDALRNGSGPGDFDGATGGIRYYLAIGPRASMALHAELHAERNRGFDPVASAASWNGGDVRVQSALLGLDFAY
jgi:hypothetical protein